MISLMRKIYIIAFVLISLNINAQDTDQNYSKKVTYKVPTTTTVNNPDITVANTEVVYYDGLGRPIQQIAHKQSNTGKDIVSHMEYDIHGRQVKEFLPYMSSGASLSYIPNTQSDVFNFYSNPDFSVTGNPDFEATSNPYSEKELENSPMSRVFKQAAPGNDWIMGSGKEIKFEYTTNEGSGSEAVKLYTVNAVWNGALMLYDINLTQNGNYGANQLYVTITKDENWVSGKNNTTEEFKDKGGKVVLKRTYNNGDAHETYYVYDQFGNLTYVIPPLANGSTINLGDMCYQYKYDYRNRLVEKKLPGKQWEYIVYNTQGMPVATGPAYNPWGASSEEDTGWLITKYDAFGRVVYTGWYTGKVVTSIERVKYQSEQDALANPFETALDGSITFDNIPLGYTNDVVPKSAFKLLTISYYDNYAFPNAPTVPTTLPDSAYPITSLVKGMATGSWIRVLDDPENTTGDFSYTLYDEKYRPVRMNTTNYLGGYIQVDTNLDWASKTLYTVTTQKRLDSDDELMVKDIFEYSPQDKLVLHKQQINQLPEQLITKNTYDELGQLISKNVGGEDVTGSLGLQKVDYSYNIRGWLKNINDVSDIESENDLFAFKINYNDYQAQGTNDSSPLLLYNGNISSTYWITSSDNVLRKYNYSYDKLNRLLEANYLKPQLASTPDNYHEKLIYDKNGNIQSLTRNGGLDSDGYQMENNIDNLKYYYDPDNQNLLKKVFDLSNSPEGFSENYDVIDYNNGQFEDNEDDYSYDANGNMIVDTNKGIDQIIYNHLNLPTRIIFGNGNVIFYLYNAMGQKVKKLVIDNSSMSLDPNIETDYLSGFQYKNAVLQFFPHAEGYVNATEEMIFMGGTSYSFNYVYNYTDHLGNIRLSYSYDPLTYDVKIMEENHYYPFGLKHGNYNSDWLMYSKDTSGSIGLRRPAPIDPVKSSYQYKYSGKEYQDELGLNMYDYGARNYDPALGRWMNIDPLAENSRRWTPYNYAYNNPIYFIDPDGMQSERNDGVEYKGGHWSDGIRSESNQESETPPDDITVNKQGIVTNVVRNDKPNKFLDENGKEINFNDIAEVDVDMKTYNFNVGDKLFTNISRDELNKLIIKGGLEPLQYNKKFYNSLGFGYFKLMAYKFAASNSHDINKADFTFSTLVNYSESLPNSRGEKYFTFGNQSTMYNLYDAGNFMWGYWMRFSLFTYPEAKAGSELNEGFQDSKADQRAIKNAYKF